MRLATFVAGGGERRVGVLRGRDVIDLNRADPTLPTEVTALLEGRPGALECVRHAVARSPSGSAAVRPAAAVKRLAPVPRPPHPRWGQGRVGTMPRG